MRYTESDKQFASELAHVGNLRCVRPGSNASYTDIIRTTRTKFHVMLFLAFGEKYRWAYGISPERTVELDLLALSIQPEETSENMRFMTAIAALREVSDEFLKAFMPIEDNEEFTKQLSNVTGT